MTATNSRIIRLLQGKARYLMTATPALNRIEDVKSFGSLEICQPKGKYIAPQSFTRTREEISTIKHKVKQRTDPTMDRASDRAIIEDPRKCFWLLYNWALGLGLIKLPDKEDFTTRYESDLVYREIMNCLLIKRSAQTPLDLPNGKKCYPRDEMPAHRVKVEELGHADKTMAVNVATVVTELLRNLNNTSDILNDYIQSIGNRDKLNNEYLEGIGGRDEL
ncbi:hypothetical protein F5144DRAFT_599134 [Chaetomium tenue]|uniref:Uncharacterized protein n=1 Tax=Chaetomium tenue TaxID=1854479 RepID=A0ACB7PIB6_9PEZI|nr:hypothetical protein F5144DRAFT_599134 [Chaetomium globosum]